MSRLRDFLDSDNGRCAGYRQRKQRRIWMATDDVEPQSKRAMGTGDRDRFRAAVSVHMKSVRRQPFAGLLALQIDLGTTSKNAPQAHTIAKNLLDLLGERRVRER